MTRSQNEFYQEWDSWLLFIQVNSFQCSSVPRPTGSSGGHEGWFSRDPLPVFFAGGPCGQFWHGQGCPLFEIVRLAFPLLTMVSSTLQGALKNDFGEVVVVCDVPKPCESLSLNTSHCSKFTTIEGSGATNHPAASANRNVTMNILHENPEKWMPFLFTSWSIATER